MEYGGIFGRAQTDRVTRFLGNGWALTHRGGHPWLNATYGFLYHVRHVARPFLLRFKRVSLNYSRTVYWNNQINGTADNQRAEFCPTTIMADGKEKQQQEPVALQQSRSRASSNADAAEAAKETRIDVPAEKKEPEGAGFGNYTVLCPHSPLTQLLTWSRESGPTRNP